MNKLLTLISILVIQLATKANCQHLILNGDTLSFRSDVPLKQYPNFDILLPQLNNLRSQEPIRCFDCGPIYWNAEWTAIENELYLTAIYSNYADKPTLKANINRLFNTHGGKIKANWVTTDLWVTKGRIIRWRDIIPLYKTEMHVFIINGKITTIKEFSYPTNKLINGNLDSLQNFINSNINWAKIPDLNGRTVRVILTFNTGASGNPENVKVIRPLDEVACCDEAKRVVSLLPWSGDYWHGEVHPGQWSLPVTFSEENRKKYVR
ncbi:MAG TPA: hypothetical protein VIJ27_07535 [Mucilaginibacter sp.]